MGPTTSGHYTMYVEALGAALLWSSSIDYSSDATTSIHKIETIKKDFLHTSACHYRGSQTCAECPSCWTG